MQKAEEIENIEMKKLIKNEILRVDYEIGEKRSYRKSK